MLGNASFLQRKSGSGSIGTAAPRLCVSIEWPQPMMTKMVAIVSLFCYQSPGLDRRLAVPMLA